MDLIVVRLELFISPEFPTSAVTVHPSFGLISSSTLHGRHEARARLLTGICVRLLLHKAGDCDANSYPRLGGGDAAYQAS